jgi:hypothetical protein
MALYLLHQGRDGVPVGVWRAPDDFFYPAANAAKQEYGKAVIANMGDASTWEEFSEQLAEKFPTAQDQWDQFEAEGTLELEEVLDEALADLTYGD